MSGVLQLSMDRLVALKILPLRLARNEEFIERLTREARSAARLCHPNIVHAYDVGSADGHYYFAMEYVDGEGLDAVVRREGPLGSERARQVMMQVAHALAAAHEAGIIHRDIKPSNIMLDSKGQVRVTDFGLAERAGAVGAAHGTALGTPAYVAPEMVAGKPVDGRSDLYSLGATFFHMLAGRPPFEGRSFSQIVMKQVNDERPALADVAPHVDPRLCRVIDRLLHKDPDGRYPSAQALLGELEALGALDPTDAVQAQVRAMIHDSPTRPLGGQPPAEDLPAPWWASRRRLTVLAACAAALCLAVGLVAFWPSGTPQTARSTGPLVTIAEQAETTREHNAEAVFLRARHAATREQWTLVQKDIARLKDEYALTEFVEKYRAAIDDLEKRAEAELQPKVVAPTAPVVPEAAGLAGDARVGPRPADAREAVVEPGPAPELPEQPGVWAALFDGRTLRGWRAVSGGEFAGRRTVLVEPGRIVLERPAQRAAIAWTGEFPTVDYELSVELMREAGPELCAVLFPVGSQHCSWNIAGWGGEITGLSMVDGKAGVDNDTRRPAACRDGRWYRARVRVTAERVEAWLDDKKCVDLPRPGRRFELPDWVPIPEPFALATWRTTLAIRNIRVQRLASRPEQPPADGAETEAAAVAISAREGWQDTGLYLTKGKRYTISAAGRWGENEAISRGPEGMRREEFKPYPLFGERILDVVGRLGPQGWPFSIGGRLELTAAQSGRLFLRMNDDYHANNWGSLRAAIRGPMLADKNAPLLSRFAKTVAKVQVRPGGGWVSSGIELRRGDRVLLSAKGSWRQRAGQPPVGPNGLNKRFKHLRAGALVGRVGPHGARFVIGELHLLQAAEDGKLYLAINDTARARVRRDIFLKGLEPLGPRGRLRGRTAPGGPIPAPARERKALNLIDRALRRLREAQLRAKDMEARRAAANTIEEPLRKVNKTVAVPPPALPGEQAVEPKGQVEEGRQAAPEAAQEPGRKVNKTTAAPPPALREGRVVKPKGPAEQPAPPRLPPGIAAGWNVPRQAGALEVTVSASAEFEQRHKQPDDSPGPPFRLLTTLKGHRSWVICVSFSPDGKHLASGSRDFTARLWDTATWRALRTLPGHQETIESVSFSPDGTRLLSRSRDRSLGLWDVATGRRLKTLSGHGDPVLSVACFPDGKWIAAGGGYRVARIWDATTYEHVRTLEDHTSEIRGPAFSPDSKRLATASFDRTIKIWTLDPDDQAAPRAALEVRPVAPGDGGAATEAAGRATVHTCAMHPQIKMPRPGKCPICAMALIENRP